MADSNAGLDSAIKLLHAASDLAGLTNPVELATRAISLITAIADLRARYPNGVVSAEELEALQRELAERKLLH